MAAASSTAMYRNLDDFLRRFKTTDRNEITHTRIGNIGKTQDGEENIYPGSYSVPPEELQTFYKLYNHKVFVKQQPEYLTEVQRKDGTGPMLVDLDFRYSPDVTTRKHTMFHISDLIEIYCEEIRKLFDVENSSFRVYVFEKPNVNRLDEVTKDGIHLVFSFQCDHIAQQVIRNKVLTMIGDVVEALPLENDHESILDDGITKGHTNWQLYGSRKPGNEAYQLTGCFDITFREVGEDWEQNELNISEITEKEILAKACARSTPPTKYNISQQGLLDYNRMKDTGKLVKTSKRGGHRNQIIPRIGMNFNVDDIQSVEQLEEIVGRMMSTLEKSEYQVYETHRFTMALPRKYYDEYQYWIRVGWALHSTDSRMFLSWMLFSSQSSKFDFDDIPKYYDMWQGMSSRDDTGSIVTFRTIMYWCKQDAPKEYKAIQEDTVDYFIKKSVKSKTEWDIAQVLFHLYKNEYRCANYSAKLWYRFSNHRWMESDKGVELRSSISKKLARIYFLRGDGNMNVDDTTLYNNIEKLAKDNKKMIESGNGEGPKGMSSDYIDISHSLRKTQNKENIMKEAGETFHVHDPDFKKNLDMNINLMCFSNGVVDFKEKVFRPGMPEDYITLSTGIKYQEIDPSNEEQKKIVNEINDFMTKLFPDAALRKYMWEHLASCLIGANVNQTFNIYNGSGSNGKSVLIELMRIVLGDYGRQVPLTLLCGQRSRIGGLSPEVAALKGVRFAYIQEPSKGDKLNDGVMKELTGGDPITARGLHKDPVTFIPQFDLALCTNSLLDIKSNDDGTWRRIRLIDFVSKFVNPCDYKEGVPNMFLKDKKLSQKFPKWAPVFAGMLVKIVFQTEGIVTDCEMVLKASREYRKNQDNILEFIDEKIVKKDGVDERGNPYRVTKQAVFEEFKCWYESRYGRQIPKGKDLYEYLDKTLGRYRGGRNSGWVGYTLTYDDEDVEDVEDDF